MLKPALRIAAVLAALLYPSLAPAQSYELLHDGAGEQVRAVCFGKQETVGYLEALHFQMEVLRKNYEDVTIAISTRMAGRGDLDCYHFMCTAMFRQPPNVIDIVVSNGLDPWRDGASYGVEARTVTTDKGTIYTPQNMGQEVYVIVPDFFVQKRP